MPTAITARFGPLEYDPIGTIDFPHGLPGFDQERHFVLVEQAALAPFVFLQSLDTPELCLPAVPTRLIEPLYELELAGEDLELLGMDRQPLEGEVLTLAIVAASKVGPPTANLLAPVVINLAGWKGVQAVRGDSRYSHRHALGGT